jgi:hypothetical protein
MKRTSLPVAYGGLWGLLALALLAVVGIWGVRIGTSFGVERDVAPVAVPGPTAVPLIATVYSNIGPPNPATLCAELSPMPKQVTVESTNGVVIETLQCSR